MGHYNPLRRRAERAAAGRGEESDASTSGTDEDEVAHELAMDESMGRRARKMRNESARRDVLEQMGRLRRLHEERDAKAALAVEMEDIKRRLTEKDAIENANSVSQAEAERLAERAAAAMAAALDAQLEVDDAYISLHLWLNHESSWASFEKRIKVDDVGVPWMCESDVPWPPDEKSMLTQMAAIERGRVVMSTDPKADASAAYKRAFKKASLRWHPDKFAAKYSAKIRPEHVQSISARVQGVSQAINDAWSALNK